jgi:predicted transcriptional regulator
MAFDDGSAAAVAETLFGRRDVMEQLVERPMDKSALIDATGTSRSTVTRALQDLQTVDLVGQENGEYIPTPYGEFVYRQFVRFADVVELGSELQTLLPHLPLDYLDFDLARLADAEVTFSSRVAPAAPLERVAELKQGTSRARTIATGHNPGGLESHHGAVVDRGQRFEVICPPALIDVIAADAEHRDMLLDLLAHDRAEVFLFDGPIPLPFGLLDETTFFGVENEQGSPLALIETTDPHVRQWAEIQFETVLEDATRLTRDAFDQNQPQRGQ